MCLAWEMLAWWRGDVRRTQTFLSSDWSGQMGGWRKQAGLLQYEPSDNLFVYSKYIYIYKCFRVLGVLFFFPRFSVCPLFLPTSLSFSLSHLHSSFRPIPACRKCLTAVSQRQAKKEPSERVPSKWCAESSPWNKFSDKGDLPKTSRSIQLWKYLNCIYLLTVNGWKQMSLLTHFFFVKLSNQIQIWVLEWLFFLLLQPPTIIRVALGYPSEVCNGFPIWRFSHFWHHMEQLWTITSLTYKQQSTEKKLIPLHRTWRR